MPLINPGPFDFSKSIKANCIVFYHGVQRRMISVDFFSVFLRLLFFALSLLYVT